MVEYPLYFSASANLNQENQNWICNTVKDIEVGIPEEFGGSKENISPEHLFLSSILNCFLGTFKVIAKNSNLEYTNINSDAKLKMDIAENKMPQMIEVIIDFHINGILDIKKAEFIVEKTKGACYIHNSVKTNIIINSRFNQ